MDATPSERWLPVVGYEGFYEVSDQGRVRSLSRTVIGRRGIVPGRLLKPMLRTKRHYPTVAVYKDGKRIPRSIHQLVLEAFVGGCPPGMECLHINDIASDNRLENLRWDTRSENIRDSVRSGKHVNTRKTHCKHGHEFTAENTRYRTRGRVRPSRECRECDQRRNRSAA